MGAQHSLNKSSRTSLEWLSALPGSLCHPSALLSIYFIGEANRALERPTNYPSHIALQAVLGLRLLKWNQNSPPSYLPLLKPQLVTISLPAYQAQYHWGPHGLRVMKICSMWAFLLSEQYPPCSTRVSDYGICSFFSVLWLEVLLRLWWWSWKGLDLCRKTCTGKQRTRSFILSCLWCWG